MSDELAVGQPVVYLRTQRGGYGFVTRVPSTVVAVGPKRVQVEFETTHEPPQTWRRWVDPKNIEIAPPMVDR